MATLRQECPPPSWLGVIHVYNLFSRRRPVIPTEKVSPCETNLWPVFFWSLPCLLAFALFLLSFPIYRPIPFWPHWEIAEVFAAWFVTVTPVSTSIAIVVLIKRRRGSARPPRLIAWLAIAVSVLANAFVLVGMAG